MYVALASRPDISYCVTALSRYNKDPLQMHLTAVKRVLRYLKQTRNHGICYTKDSHGSTVGFTDSDWAGRVAAWKSVGGFWGSSIWANTLTSENPVRGSSVDTRSRVCSMFGCYLRGIMAQATGGRLPPSQNPERPLRTCPIVSDNQGALKLIATRITKQQTKHIAVKYHHSHD